MVRTKDSVKVKDADFVENYKGHKIEYSSSSDTYIISKGGKVSEIPSTEGKSQDLAYIRKLIDEDVYGKGQRDSKTKDEGLTPIFSEKGYKINKQPSGVFTVETPKYPVMTFHDLNEARQALTYRMKKDGVYGKGQRDSKTKDASSDEYIVNVGNIGNIVCASEQEALKTFDEYVRQSKSTSGRAAGEDVVLFKNGYPIKDFVGSRSRRQLY
jgi:hypothetical protein